MVKLNLCKSASSRRPIDGGYFYRTHLRPAGFGVPGYEKIGVLQTPTPIMPEFISGAHSIIFGSRKVLAHFGA